MSERKKILILFEGAHIAYSPAISQLHNELIKYLDVTILTSNPLEFSENIDLSYNMQFYKYRSGPVRYFYKIFYHILLLFNKEARLIESMFKNNYQEYFFRFLKMKKAIYSKEYDFIICVDLKNLFFVNVVLKKRSCFFSLEVCYSEKVLPFIDTDLIDSVIIQSQIRYEYLFGNIKIITFYIQNAPTFNRHLIKGKRAGLIYSGTAWKPFGLEFCLNYLAENSKERLMIAGTIKDDLIEKNAKYRELLIQNRLLINKQYIPDAGVVEFISDFEIGFCFYDFEIEWINNFNYQSAPAGKMFKYLAAGVPVVCNKIVGFDFVNEFKCGICIDTFDPESIKRAIEQIRSDYGSYVVGAINAASHFSFDKAIIPFLDHVKNNLKIKD